MMKVLLIGHHRPQLMGDADGLARQILTLSQDSACREQMATAAGRHAAHDLSFYQTTAPLRAWVERPARAPDRRKHSFAEKRRQWEYQGRAMLRLLLWRLRGQDQ